MERVRLFFVCLAGLLIHFQCLFASTGRPENGSWDDFSVFVENGKVGLKDEEGQVLIPASYEEIGWSNGKLSIVDKVVGYRSNGLWGLIHTSNKLVTAAEFTELKPGEGSFLVAKKKSDLSQRASFGIINTSGKTVIPFLYDGLQLSNMRAIVISKAGTRFHSGLLDFSNKVLIPLEYQRIYSLGSLRFAVENFENKTAIFSDDGSQVTGFLIDSISAFRNNFAVVYQNQRQGLIDRNGQVIVKPVYGELRFTRDGAVEARNMDNWFFLDAENRQMGQQLAEAVIPLSPQHYAIRSGGKIQLTDNEFRPLSPTFFSSLSPFSNGVALCKTAAGSGAIDAEGKVVLPPAYHQLIIDGHVYLACTDDRYKNAWTVLDASGKSLTQKHYEYIGPSNGRFRAVKSRGFWGAINSAGKEIISCVHDSLVQRKGEYVAVKFKGEYGVIDLAENWIVTPQPNRVRILNDETFFEFNGKTTFLKSFTGNIIYFSDNRLDFDGHHIREHLPNGAYWVIDMNGIILDRSNQPEGTEQIFPESEGLRAIRKDGKYGFIDEQGRLRIANRYEEVKPFSEGMAAVRIMNQWGFIDSGEKLVVQPVYDGVENFRNGVAIVKRNGQSGLIDASGNIVLPLRYEEIMLNANNRWVLRQGGLYGLADAGGRVLIHPKYEELTDTGNGYAIVRRQQKSGLLTLGGVSTIPRVYDGLVFDPYHNRYMALKKSAWETVVGVPAATEHAQ
ncbi:MAG TPA: WG repeat-containing protein [Chryseosolibacter sp.]